MYSTSALASWFGRVTLIGVALGGCAPVQETSSQRSPLSTEQTFVVTSQRDSIDHGSVVVFALDFSSRRRVIGVGDRQIDSVHPLPGNIAGCARENEAAYVAAMGSDLRPKDSGYVGAVTVELSNGTRAPEAASTMCFAVHTRGGGWTWNWTPVPIIIDRGSPDFTGQPGVGHFDLDVRTADVDLIALTMGYGGEALTSVTYTAIPSQ
jgi:hypothetical protein